MDGPGEEESDRYMIPGSSAVWHDPNEVAEKEFLLELSRARAKRALHASQQPSPTRPQPVERPPSNWSDIFTSPDYFADDYRLPSEVPLVYEEVEQEDPKSSRRRRFLDDEDAPEASAPKRLDFLTPEKKESQVLPTQITD